MYKIVISKPARSNGVITVSLMAKFGVLDYRYADNADQAQGIAEDMRTWNVRYKDAEIVTVQ